MYKIIDVMKTGENLKQKLNEKGITVKEVQEILHLNAQQWHYYISSCELTPEELMHHARMEWSVETMHWMLYVYFAEDWCRVEKKNSSAKSQYCS